MIGYYNCFENNSIMNKEFDREPTYEDNSNNKYMKSKIKEFRDRIDTNFYNKKIPKEKIPYKFLSLIMLESVFRTKEDCYYPQTFLEECNCKIKDIQKIKRIDYYFDKNSSDESDNEPDSETVSEPDNESDNESEKSSKKSDNNESEKSSKTFD